MICKVHKVISGIEVSFNTRPIQYYRLNVGVTLPHTYCGHTLCALTK